jgi:hypothetical protein
VASCQGVRKPVEKWVAEDDLSAYLASSIKSEADIDWTSEADKQAFLGAPVENAQRVIEMVGNHAPAWPHRDTLACPKGTF